MNRRRNIALGVIPALLLYVGSYAVLSVQGQYAPLAWGLGWVKGYRWAPLGFVSGPYGIEFHLLPRLVYLPLWSVDIHFVHNNPYDGKHPINTKLDTELHERLKMYNELKELQQKLSHLVIGTGEVKMMTNADRHVEEGVWKDGKFIGAEKSP